MDGDGLGETETRGIKLDIFRPLFRAGEIETSSNGHPALPRSCRRVNGRTGGGIHSSLTVGPV